MEVTNCKLNNNKWLIIFSFISVYTELGFNDPSLNNFNFSKNGEEILKICAKLHFEVLVCCLRQLPSFLINLPHTVAHPPLQMPRIIKYSLSCSPLLWYEFPRDWFKEGRRGTGYRGRGVSVVYMVSYECVHSVNTLRIWKSTKAKFKYWFQSL